MSRTNAASLKRYLQTLPQQDRYILLLSLADGLTTTEVAAVLDLPESTVQTRLAVLRQEAEWSIRPTIDATDVLAASLDTDAVPMGV